ncbi:hypothetical protein [Sulfurimonas sp.]|uniref:hypothetical protein n=1 Tax=Sulfurimonas sp. TaxID=2022749 RepID=UPI002AB1EF97|nr:hypothetical protein [Sulfurimonas sp.]
MAFKNILNFFRKKEKQRAYFADILGKESSKTKESGGSRLVPILDDVFEETSTGVLAQIKKYPFLNLAEFLETQRTSFNKHTIFVVEILDDVVNAAIVSRKGVFLDIGFLKSYSYENLKDIYFQIVPDSTDTLEEISNSIENIISIVAYDVVYALPKKIVIIENSNSDLKELTISTGRFSNDANINDLMLRELAIETGYSEDEIIYSNIKKLFKKGDRAIGFLISWSEKIYFESVDDYVNKAGFELKKLHSIQSSLYASFSLKDRDATMRIHVQDFYAYSLYKIKNEIFEYRRYDIKEEYEDLELIVSQMQEVILSGYGDYYEMLKSSFLQEGIAVRWWNYGYDLESCIIRTEQETLLDGRYANLISTSYYELFNMRLALVRLGIGVKLSFYEFIAVNLNILPIMMIILFLLGATGWFYYEKMELDSLKKINKEYSRYFQQEKSLNSELSRYQNNISTTKNKITTVKKIMKNKVEIQDAFVLYKIANKLPIDMILTEIQKKNGVITIKGKCYLESSLLKFIKRLEIKGRSVYLMSMKDSKKTRFESHEEANLRYITEQQKKQQEEQKEGGKGKVSQNYNIPRPTGTTVQYSDTLNNSFTLEIR